MIHTSSIDGCRCPLEFEMSQFLEKTLPRGRENYYGTTYLYIVGEGLVPWDTVQTGAHQPGVDFQRDSKKIPEKASGDFHSYKS